MINGRFIGIQCAISDVVDLTYKTFYQMDRSGGASGSSSLNEPTDLHPHKIEKVITVPTIPLSSLLEKFKEPEIIEHVKTDCETHDFNVIKSAGPHLNRICFISSEMTKNTHHHHGSYNQNDFLNFMAENGFKVIRKRWGIKTVNNGEVHFMNTKLTKYIKKNKYESTTFGL